MSTAFEKQKLRHSLGRPSRSDFVQFGFILRYPVGKQEITGTSYEPWHYRYVGVEAAKDIHEEGICLEEYME